MAMLLISCTSGKTIATNNDVKFLKVKAFVQKSYPGVSGEVHYFVQYRVELDVETNQEVQFKHLVIGETEIPVNSVSVGMTLLNTDRGEHLKQDTQGVRLKASHPVYHKETAPSINSVLEEPETITLVYLIDGEEKQYEITTIEVEPNEYRPSVNPGGRE